MLIDSHAHLDDKRFDADRDMLINSLKENNVDLVLNIGADMQTSRASLDLAKKYDNIYAVVGVHPHSAKDLEGSDLNELRVLAQQDKVLAIGEIGLDYFYDNSPRDIQQKWFKKQIELAQELDMPVVIHSREATKDTFDILKEASQKKKLRGILHSYAGSYEMALEYIKLGFYIAIGGPVTFKNARVSREVAAQIPLDKLLIETDSPYLTPEPYRGKRNEPMYVKYVAEKIAEVRGTTFEEIASNTTRNLLRLFELEEVIKL
ncbi:MAG: TatD family hydrolase [Gudongella sp.]|jgi:TatD DNase family protein|nr:TatD family hydrolase [Gudongella sp.]